jgi:D-sedoheptulose 7-phosphate isomerase
LAVDQDAVWRRSLNEARETLNQFLAQESTFELCRRFSTLLIDTMKNGGNLFTCGNGGSHCDAMHFAEELTGRYRKDRRALGALALGDASHVTCVSNDYGFEHIFARQIDGLGRKGDLLVGMSTSGNSKNVILAFEAAKKKGIRTVALLGKYSRAAHQAHSHRDRSPRARSVSRELLVPSAASRVRLR